MLDIVDVYSQSGHHSQIRYLSSCNFLKNQSLLIFQGNDAKDKVPDEKQAIGIGLHQVSVKLQNCSSKFCSEVTPKEREILQST